MVLCVSDFCIVFHYYIQYLLIQSQWQQMFRYVSRKTEAITCMYIWLPSHVAVHVTPTLGMHVGLGVNSILAASTNQS